MENIFLNAPVTCTLILLVFGFSAASIYRRPLFLKMILHPFSIVKQGEYYRMVSAYFVHNDLMHLFLNEACLFFIGGNLENELRARSPHGSIQFIFIYVVSLVCGALYTTIRHRSEFDYSSAGASGAIFGILMGYMLLKPHKIAFYVPVFGGLPNIYAGVLYIFILFYYQKRSNNPMVDNEMHFFGALGGIAATLALYPHLIF